MHLLFRRPFRFAAGALLAFLPLLCSAQAYKCTENGTTTFQTLPCSGEGKKIHVESGPSQQSIQDAQDRAARDKQAAWSSYNAQQQQQNQQRPVSPIPTQNCSKMLSELDSAQAEYNQLSRDAGMPDATVAGLRNNNRLLTLSQQRLNSAKMNVDMYGCKPPSGTPMMSR